MLNVFKPLKGVRRAIYLKKIKTSMFKNKGISIQRMKNNYKSNAEICHGELLHVNWLHFLYIHTQHKAVSQILNPKQ